MNEYSADLNNAWVSVREETGDENFRGWFRHSYEENGYYLDIYQFWIEGFNKDIHLTAENLHYGIFHHCLDKDAFELANGKVDITKLKTISLYAEHAPSFRIEGSLNEPLSRVSERARIQSEIRNLPDYLDLLDRAIHGLLDPKEAERVSSGVLSATIL